MTVLYNRLATHPRRNRSDDQPLHAESRSHSESQQIQRIGVSLHFKARCHEYGKVDIASRRFTHRRHPRLDPTPKTSATSRGPASNGHEPFARICVHSRRTIPSTSETWAHLGMGGKRSRHLDQGEDFPEGSTDRKGHAFQPERFVGQTACPMNPWHIIENNAMTSMAPKLRANASKCSTGSLLQNGWINPSAPS